MDPPMPGPYSSSSSPIVPNPVTGELSDSFGQWGPRIMWVAHLTWSFSERAHLPWRTLNPLETQGPLEANQCLAVHSTAAAPFSPCGLPPILPPFSGAQGPISKLMARV